MNHKRHVVLSIALALFLGWFSPVDGQEVFLGARGGISVTDYSLPYLSEDWRSGAVVGAFLNVPFGDHLSLQPELSFVRKGADWFKEGSGPTRADLDYAEAFVSARFSLPLGEGFFLSLFGGPWLGVLANCTTDSPDDPDGCNSVFGPDDHKTMDLGWSVGLGAGFQRGPWITQMDMRWSRGFSGILEDRPSDNPSTRSTQLSLGIGYRVSGG